MKKKSTALLLAVLTVLGSVVPVLPVTATNDAEAQSTSFAYEDLYVKDGLVFEWDAYNFTAGASLPTSLTNKVDQTAVTYAKDKAEAGDGYMLYKGTLDLSAFLPTQTHEEKTVLADMTFELVLAQNRKLIGTSFGVANGTQNIGILNGFSMAGISSTSSDVSQKGFINGCYKRVYSAEPNKYIDSSVAASTNQVQIAVDEAWTKKTFISAPLGVPYSIAYVLSYELKNPTLTSETGLGDATVALFRDGQRVLRSTFIYYEGMTSTAIKFGHSHGFEYYAARIYTRTLSEAELHQNHFADICAYNKLDMTAYTALTAEEQATLHASFANTPIDAENIEKIFEAAVAMKGHFAPSIFDMVVELDGYAVCLYTGASIRAVFSIDNLDVKNLEEAGFVVEFGSVMTAAGETPILTYDAASGSFKAGNEETNVYAAYRNKKRLVEFLPGDEGYSTFAHATDFSDEDAILYADKQLVWRSYIAISDGQNGYVSIAEIPQSRFGDSVSLKAIYDYSIMNGYDAYPIVNEVCGPLMSHVLRTVSEELKAARSALSKAETLLKERDHFFALTDEKLAIAEGGGDAFDAYYAAYTADLAYRAALIDTDELLASLDALNTATSTLSAAVLSAIADFDANADAAHYASLLADPFAAKHTDITATANLRGEDSALAARLSAACTATKGALGITGSVDVTVNGHALADYLLFGDDTDRAVNLLVDTLFTEKKIALPVLPLELAAFAGDAKAVILGDRRCDTYGMSVLETDDKGSLYLYGNEQNGVYHAVLKLIDLLKESNRIMMNEKKSVKVADVLEQTYAVDSFFNDDGTINTDSTEPLTIVCIGGSLTELGKTWTNAMQTYFSKRFPNREVTVYNAGVGGTGSDFGAKRFYEHVLSYNPDLVIIEFSVNDTNSSENGAKVYLEAMLQECTKQQKIPGVIYAHTPLAIDKDDPLYATWKRQANWKDDVLNHYGVSQVNIYDYFYRCYEQEKKASGNYAFTFLNYLEDMYRKLNPGESTSLDSYYDVHPISSGRGYQMYADALIEAFDNDLAGMLTRIKYADDYCQNQGEILGATYNFITHNSDRLTYEGTWETWTLTNKYSNADSLASLGGHRYVYPFMADGIRRAYKQSGAVITFQTTADSIAIYYHGQKNAAKVNVYVNGSSTSAGYLCGSIAQQPFGTSEVKLNNPNNELITVRIVVDEPTASAYSFAFGYIIEKFNEK